MSNPFEISLAWNCDFCNKPGLIEGQDGVIYCKYCHKTYGKRMSDYLTEEEKMKFSERLSELLPPKKYVEVLRRMGMIK